MTHHSIIVGYASDPWEPSHGTWYDTHIGGIPVFPPGLHIDVPSCPICSETRFCVLQAFAPHSRHYERVIYLFGCNNIKCSQQEAAWWAVRVCSARNDFGQGGQPAAAEIQAEEKQKAEKPVIDWDTDSEACSSDSSDLADDLELLSLQVQLANAKGRTESVSSQGARPKKRQPTPSVATSPTCQPHESSRLGSALVSISNPAQLTFQAYHVQVADEPQSPQPVVHDAYVDRLLCKYREDENTLSASDNTETWAAEKEEDISTERRQFELFQERIQRAPGHILRYDFGGQPLWPKIPSAELSPRTCHSCGSDVVFELQVLGSCLHYLQPEKSVAEHQNEAGMAFASVAIFTCSADCTMNHLLAETPSFKVVSQTVCVQSDDW